MGHQKRVGIKKPHLTFFLGGEVQPHHVFLCKKLRVTKKTATHTSVPSVPLVPGGLKVTKVKTQRELESTILRRTGKDHWNQLGSKQVSPKGKFGHQKKHWGGEVKKGQGKSFQACFVGLWCHDVVKDPKKKGQKEFVTFNDPKTKGLEATLKGPIFLSSEWFPFDGIFWSLFVFGWNDCHEFEEMPWLEFELPKISWLFLAFSLPEIL